MIQGVNRGEASQQAAVEMLPHKNAETITDVFQKAQRESQEVQRSEPITGGRITSASPWQNIEEAHAQAMETGEITQSQHYAINELQQARENIQNGARPLSVFKNLHGAFRPIVEGDPEMLDLHRLAGERLEVANRLDGFELHQAEEDIFIIFIRILQLLNKQLKLDRDSRVMERDLETMHKKRVADNFSSQGKWLLNTAIGAGILSILAGVFPILQQSAAGDSVYGWLPNFLKSNAPKDKLFDGYRRMCTAMSKINENTGQIYTTYAKGWETTDDHKSRISQLLGDDWTRDLEDLRQYFNNLLNALLHEMQAQKEVAGKINS